MKSVKSAPHSLLLTVSKILHHFSKQIFQLDKVSQISSCDLISCSQNFQVPKEAVSSDLALGLICIPLKGYVISALLSF